MYKKRTLTCVSLGLSFLLAVTAIGHSVAIYTKEATQTGFTIGASPKYAVTYHLPRHNSESDTEFTSTSIQIEQGASLYDALSEYASAKGNYSFVSWHTTVTDFRNDDEDYNTHLVANDASVTANIEVWAKYVQSNVLYYYDTGDKYVYSSQNSANSVGITFSSDDSSHYKVYYGDKIYSYSGVEGSSIDLGRKSGRYTLTKNGTTDWTVKRLIDVNFHNFQSWWLTEGGNPINTHIYVFNSSNNYWISRAQDSFVNFVYHLEMDLSYSAFIVTRSFGDTGGWSDKERQSTDISINENGCRTDGTILWSADHYNAYLVYDSSTLSFNWW